MFSRKLVSIGCDSCEPWSVSSHYLFPTVFAGIYACSSEVLAAYFIFWCANFNFAEMLGICEIQFGCFVALSLHAIFLA